MAGSWGRVVAVVGRGGQKEVTRRGATIWWSEAPTMAARVVGVGAAAMDCDSIGGRQ